MTMTPSDFKEIQFIKTNPDAILPTRAHSDDAGLDIYSCEDFTLKPHEGKIIKTGVCCAIEKGFVGMIADRSSMGKKGIKTLGGIIDAGYRGEIGVILWNLTSEPFSAKKGERIAQMLLLPIATPAVKEVSELDNTARGAGGFGSTGQ